MKPHTWPCKSRTTSTKHTFSNYVRIQDVVQKTCLRRVTIGNSGERGSGISVLPARHDDDDEFGGKKRETQRIIHIYVFAGVNEEYNQENPIKRILIFKLHIRFQMLVSSKTVISICSIVTINKCQRVTGDGDFNLFYFEVFIAWLIGFVACLLLTDLIPKAVFLFESN